MGVGGGGRRGRAEEARRKKFVKVGECEGDEASQGKKMEKESGGEGIERRVDGRGMKGKIVEGCEEEKRDNRRLEVESIQNEGRKTCG